MNRSSERRSPCSSGQTKLTASPTAFARPLLALKGLDGYFVQAFGGDAFARKKPDPLPLLETCRALGSEPSRTLMVGDSSNDAAAARAAGCPVVLVSYGYNHGEPVADAGADAGAGARDLPPQAGLRVRRQRDDARHAGG